MERKFGTIIRRILALVLTICCLLSLSACAGEGETNTTKPPETVPSSSQTVTEPVTTQPPTTEPPTTEPPTTQPPTTEPPTTEPPVTRPPVVDEPPITKPPLTDNLPVVPGTVEITMTFVGDCTLGSNQKMSYWRSFQEYYANYGADYFLKNVRPIFEQDDITVINLEGTLTTSTDIQDKKWNHKGDPEFVKVLSGSSVEVATLGNNHIMDYGISGANETIRVLEGADIEWSYNDIPAIYEVKGIRVGVVSVNVLSYGWKVETWLKDCYRQLREAGCAIVVACAHWGGDKVTELEDYQRNLGTKIIDMGYDLVVGHHPHVLQGIRRYRGRYICYSLGNFCYGGNKNPDDKDSGIFQQTFTVVDGQVVIDDNVRFIPCYLSGKKNENDYQPTLAYGAEFDRIIKKMNGYGAEFSFALNADGTSPHWKPKPPVPPTTEPEPQPTEPTTTEAPTTEPEPQPTEPTTTEAPTTEPEPQPTEPTTTETPTTEPMPDETVIPSEPGEEEVEP